MTSPGARTRAHPPDVDDWFSYELMAKDTIAFLEQAIGGPAHVVGCSDGATVH